MIFDVESMKKAMVEFEVRENLSFAANVSYCGCINPSLPFSSDWPPEDAAGEAE